MQANYHNRKGSKGFYLDLDLFDARRLRDDESALETALGVLESLLQDPAVNVKQVVELLSTSPNLMEFLLSILGDDSYRLFTDRILATFPTKLEDIKMSAIFDLIQHIGLFLLFLPFPAESIPEDLKECRHTTNLMSDALKALSTMPPFARTSNAVQDTASSRRQTQRTKKQKIRDERCAAVDPTPFINIKVNVPQSQKEADTLLTTILEGQKEVLQRYFDILRYPCLKDIIKASYIPSDDIASSAENSDAAAGVTTNIVPIDGDTTDMRETSAPAYPMVQPMKAALYFESAEGLGAWRILISTRADRNLRETRKKDPKLFNIILKKIKELSIGHFSDDNQKKLNGSVAVDIPIFEAKMTRDTRLVYQVDCVPEFESNIERQVLRIFGIYRHAQIDRRFWDAMGYQVGRLRGKEYRLRCIFRNKPYHPGDSVVGPASFPLADRIINAESSSMDGVSVIRAEDLEEIHSLLVLEKFVTFSQDILESIISDREAAYVFEMSLDEKKIIEHRHSCYVIGRSGTGKTTTMLFKMLGMERAYRNSGFRDTVRKPRQLFVTQSRVLAEKVKEYFDKLLQSHVLSEQKIQEKEGSRNEKDLRTIQRLVDHDEEIYFQRDLPTRFGELQDEHFPMFITFDHLSRLLEADLNATSNKSVPGSSTIVPLTATQVTHAEDEPSLSNDYMQQRRPAFVSYASFLDSYWAHFPQSLTKGLDPALVFNEFMGVIKGSEQTIKNDYGYLEKQAYNDLSHRSQSTYANQRDITYQLFEAYTQRKRERREYDAADRTHRILKGLQNESIPENKVDFIYVDEAQDNLLIDALVIRSICKNPNGLFWAGDTAQTISVGSSFRFDDLKAFMYRMENERRIDLNYGKQIQPKSFHLGTNYRSHAGIVKCGHSIIELISMFWPDTIDQLTAERGLVEGAKPVFFSGWDKDIARYEQFLFGESGNKVEFGAEQCILVRNEAARNQLKAAVGDIGLIMTIHESKGLEFDDVLIYDFFENSDIDASRWRLVLGALPVNDVSKYSTPRFDERKHRGICRELKFLYVAITRARKNLWIADSSKKGEPIRFLWNERNLIQDCRPGMDVPRLATSSSPEAWARTAYTLFNNKSYMQAEHAFERASLYREKAVANAYFLREKARTVLDDSRETLGQRSQAFVNAADAFAKCAEKDPTDKLTYYRISAECYVLSGDDLRGAEAYLCAEEYTLSALHFRKAGRFDEAIQVVTKHRNNMDAKVVNNVVGVSKLFYLKNAQIEQARDLFSSDTAALEFMDDYGLDVAQAAFLERMNRYSEAAELHWQEGRRVEAIRLFSADKENSKSARRACRCLLDALWFSFTFQLEPRGLNESTIHDLFQLSSVLIDEFLVQERDELSMFQALISGDQVTLLQLGQRFYHLGTDIGTAASLLCFDYVFSSPMVLDGISASLVAVKLAEFLPYVQTLQRLAAIPYPRLSKVNQILFGFCSQTETEYLIPNLTTLYPRLRDHSVAVVEQGILVTHWELDRIIKSILNNLLRSKVNELNNICRRASVFKSLCLSHLSGRCGKNECSRAHIDIESYSADDYNTRLRIHLQQILIYQTIDVSERKKTRQALEQRRCLSQLYEVLYPSFYKLGSIHNIDETCIPELRKGFQVVKYWIQTIFYSIDLYSEPDWFITSLARFATLAFNNHANDARVYIFQSPCVVNRKPWLLRGNDYVVYDLLDFIQDCNCRWSLNQGVSFVQYILANRVPIDINVLCNLLDNICAMIIISKSIWRYNSLHNVTLPLSWLIVIARSRSKFDFRDARLGYLYLKPLAELLEQIYTGYGADHLLFEGTSLANLVIGHGPRSILITRICKNIGLLGYNVAALRTDVVQTASYIWGPTRLFHREEKLYVCAESWDQIKRAVQHSTEGTSLDELIQLQEAPKTPMFLRPIPGVRQIIYNTPADIPAFLNTRAPSSTQENVETRPIYESENEAEVTEPGQQSRHEDLPDDTGDGDGEVTVDVISEQHAAHTDDADAGRVNGDLLESTQQIAAARIFQAAYRRLLVRRRTSAKTGVQAMKIRIVGACWTASQTMEWSKDSRYRLCLLYFLPHVLFCLEGVRNRMQVLKDSAKKRLKTAVHQDLDELRERMTLLNAFLKELDALHNVLKPGSELNRRHDTDALKKSILQVEELMKRLPFGAVNEWEGDLHRAIKGIIRPIEPTQPKPELNVEDEFDLVDLI